MIVKIGLICLYFQRTTIQTYSYKKSFPGMKLLTYSEEDYSENYSDFKISDANFFLWVKIEFQNSDSKNPVIKTFDVRFAPKTDAWIIKKKQSNTQPYLEQGDLAFYVSSPIMGITLYQITVQEMITQEALLDYMQIKNWKSKNTDFKGYEFLMNNPPSNVENFNNYEYPSIYLTEYKWNMDSADLIMTVQTHSSSYNEAIKEINKLDGNENYKGLKIEDDSKLIGIGDLKNLREKQLLMETLFNDIVQSLFFNKKWVDLESDNNGETNMKLVEIKDVLDKFKQVLITKTDNILEEASKQELPSKSHFKSALNKEIINLEVNYFFKELNGIHFNILQNDLYLPEDNTNVAYWMIRLVSNLFITFQSAEEINTGWLNNVFPGNEIKSLFNHIETNNPDIKSLILELTLELNNKLEYCFSGVWLQFYSFFNHIEKIREFLFEYYKDIVALELIDEIFPGNLITLQSINDVRHMFFYEEVKEYGKSESFEIFDRSDRLNRLLLV